MTRLVKDHDPRIKALEDEMMEWIKGRRSMTNYIAGTFGPDQAHFERIAIIIADTAEVQKLSAAILALKG